jgi:hypothetical protein
MVADGKGLVDTFDASAFAASSLNAVGSDCRVEALAAVAVAVDTCSESHRAAWKHAMMMTQMNDKCFDCCCLSRRQPALLSLVADVTMMSARSYDLVVAGDERKNRNSLLRTIHRCLDGSLSLSCERTTRDRAMEFSLISSP